MCPRHHRPRRQSHGLASPPPATLAEERGAAGAASKKSALKEKLTIEQWQQVMPANSSAVTQTNSLPAAPALSASLFAAVKEGDQAAVKEALANGVEIDATNKNGDTALMTVAKYVYPEFLKLLVASGAIVNVAGAEGRTALIYASCNGQLENVKLLPGAGADVLATATHSDKLALVALHLTQLSGQEAEANCKRQPR